MKKRQDINATITLLASREGVVLHLEDEDSGARFFSGALSTEMFTAALGRLACCKFEVATVSGLDKIGKVRQIDNIQFEMPDSDSYNKKIAAKRAVDNCPEGWEPDLYFDSQGSFVMKDRKNYANCTIRRWVDKQVAEGGES
jgi:hypothetical protein